MVSDEYIVACQLVAEYVAGVEDDGPFTGRLVRRGEYILDVLTYGYHTKDDSDTPSWNRGVNVGSVAHVVSHLN